VIVAHVAGLPLEETLATGGPALLTVLTFAAAGLRARLRRGHAGLRQRTGEPGNALDRRSAR
jgi:hypothetical protein